MHHRIAAVSLVVVLTVPAFAADRKVPSTYPTIAEAVTAAEPGDKIVVSAGVYAENIVTAKEDLHFLGKGKAYWDGTLADGTAGVCLTATGGKTVVEGFTFRAGQADAAQVQLTGADCRVYKCTARGPSTRFLTIIGEGAEVDSCTLFAVDSDAVVITGDNALVQKVTARQCDDDVISVIGNRATVKMCKFFLNEDNESITVTGDDATVSQNQFTDCDETILVTGDNAQVDKNKCTNCGGIYVVGDNAKVSKNTILSAPNDQVGVSVTSRTTDGGGTIEGNNITDASQSGLVIACHNATVKKNKVTRAGTEDNESGCVVSGNGNKISDVTVVGGGTHGFDVSGDNNELTKCTANDSAADGFHISGDGNSLNTCKATLNSGEGFDNGGLGTSSTKGTFKDNRIDVANDGTITDAASFADDNKFTTGSTTTLPQVD